MSKDAAEPAVESAPAEPAKTPVEAPTPAPPEAAGRPWWAGAWQSVIGGIVAGVAASLILDGFAAYRQNQRDQQTYDAIRGQLAKAAESFREGTLSFAGLDEKDGRFARGNIYRVPTFPFALFDAVNRHESVFIAREGESFLGVQANVGRMRDAYNEIIAKRQGSRSDGRLDWDTRTWNQYFRPACHVCEWAGVPIDDIKPPSGF